MWRNSEPVREAQDLSRQAQTLHRLGRVEEARRLHERALEHDPHHVTSLHGLGVLATQARDPERGVAWFGRAIALEPHEPRLHASLAAALRAAGRPEEALASLDRAVDIEPGVAELHLQRGICRLELREIARALEDFEDAVRLRPDFAQAWFHRGLALRAAGREDGALESYRRALDLDPDFAEAHNNLGNLLARRGEPEAAERSLARAVRLKPHSAAMQTSHGVVLLALRRPEQALASFEAAIALDPRLARAHGNRGLALAALRRYEAALASFEQCTMLEPRAPEGYLNQSNLLREMRRFEAARERMDRALECDPAAPFARGMRLHLRMQVCEWDGLAPERARIEAELRRGEPACPPHPALAFCASPMLQRAAAETWVRENCSANASLGPIAARPARERLRIGYFSADFREHAVPILAAELFERHDRTRFEIVAFSCGPNTGDPTRRRLERAFDRFHDVEGRSDREIALLARREGVDLAVDLGGFTQGARPGIFALRAAPIQLGYLGYPGTSGAPYMDYLIADPVLVPEGCEGHYSERLLRLPVYQVNDASRPIAERVFTRAELGLPPAGFVFCCFNASYKITPETFDSWMRILGRVSEAVLYLFAGSEAVEMNLRREAARRGIDPSRLFFGKWLPPAEYRARLRVADLFLDTLPYNAGTTASDALWAGLPVLTLAGDTFASRMGASLLGALDMPELIATTPEQYEQSAVTIATQPSKLAGIRRTLTERRNTGALFDANRFVVHLEAGYRRIHERSLAGLPPEHVQVGALDIATRRPLSSPASSPARPSSSPS